MVCRSEPASRPDRGLTPAQHGGVVRRQIALIPTYVILIFGWGMLFSSVRSNSPTPAPRDFVHFYTQGAVANARDAQALYDVSAQMALQDSAIGLACVTLAFFALRAERPFLAGLAIGSLAYKPQLGPTPRWAASSPGDWCRAAMSL